MYFYKYQKPNTLEFNMLRKGEIYFASVSELNDASECRPRFILKGSEELWQRLARFILQGVVFCSERFSERELESISSLLNLGNSIGTQLKRYARNRDLGIEELGEVFVKILAPLIPKEQAFDLVHLTRLTKQFIGFLKCHGYLDQK